ncbi:MAG: hypothetical protein KDG50_12420 [Chromatiales bacterium]|nr:hypothetical protein [Chromatiales bacterium]
MKKKLAVAVVLVFLLSLMPSGARTWKWASDAYGLVVLATLEPDQVSRNPYSEHGLLVSPDLAVWMLKSFAYPYDRCSKLSETLGLCGKPLVGWVGRTLDAGSPESAERGYALLAHFVSRGEDVNALTDGMAPVHEAILYRNPRYLNALLAAGANLAVKIDRPEKDYDGFDAVEFLALLESRQPDGFGEIRAIVDEHRSFSRR